MANPIVQQISAELESLQKELGRFKSNVEYFNEAKYHMNEAVKTVNYAEGNFNKKIEDLKNTYDSVIKLTDEVTSVVVKIDTINFPERLDNIDNTVQKTITSLNEIKEATLWELQKASEIITKADFDGRFKNLQRAIDSSVTSNEELANTIERQKLPDKIDELTKNFNQKLDSSVNELANTIDNQKLPDRIDGLEKNINLKLDTSIADLQLNTKQIADQTAKSIHDLNLPIRMDKLDANISGILSAIQNVQSRIESVERNMGDKLKDATDKQTKSLSDFQDKINQTIKGFKQEFITSSIKQQKYTYITWALIALSAIAIIIISKL